MNAQDERALPVEVAQPGTPGPIPAAAYLSTGLRTWLLAVALWGMDARRALRHLDVMGDDTFDRLLAVAMDSHLVDQDLGEQLTATGWAILPSLTH